MGGQVVISSMLARDCGSVEGPGSYFWPCWLGIVAVWSGPGSYFWPCWPGIVVVWSGPGSYFWPGWLGIVAVWMEGAR